MENKQTRINAYTLKRIRNIGKEIGNPTDDTIFRYIVDKYDSMQIEIELLKKQNKELIRAVIDLKASKGIE